MTVDAHQHFWELGRFDDAWLNAPRLSAIRRNFLPADLRPQLAAAGIDRSIFVQTQHTVEENRWALRLADENSLIAGVVGWVDLASPDCEAQLREFKGHAKFVGVRHVTQDEPDDDFIVREDVLRGLRVLERLRVPFDLLFFTRHLRHALTLARTLPDLRMVIDHLSKPPIKSRRLDPWVHEICAAARYSNMYCKISGMVTEADWEHWTVDDLRPYVELVLEAFGPTRCMFGSDWPVCELAGSYQRVVDAAREWARGLSTSDQAAVFGGTAVEFYGLKP